MLRVEFANRWDALAFTRELAWRSWYMFEPDDEHWDVCLPLERGDNSGEKRLRQEVERWLSDPQVEAHVVGPP
jgi:hypothetical protein